MSNEKHGHVTERIHDMDVPCEACDGGPAVARATLDPRDYEGVNLGPDAVCTLALCDLCLHDFLPWVELTA